MLVINELVTENLLVRSVFKQMSYKQVKNLFKLIYIKRASYKIYMDDSSISSFLVNNLLT